MPSSWSLPLAWVYLAAVPVYPHECYSLDGTEPLRPVERAGAAGLYQVTNRWVILCCFPPLYNYFISQKPHLMKGMSNIPESIGSH